MIQLDMPQLFFSDICTYVSSLTKKNIKTQFSCSDWN